MEEREEDVPGVKDALAFEEEHERLASKYQSEKVLLEKALKASGNSSPRTSSPEPVQLSTVENEKNTSPLQSSDNEKIPDLKKCIPLEPIAAVPGKKPCVKSVRIAEVLPAKSTQEESPEDMKKREDYLKARRDKLVALKKQARSQRLEMTKTRPGSAKVAAEASIHGTRDFEASQIPEPSIIQVRKALAVRLKAEVVGP